MIAVDTSTWIAFLQGDGGEDTELRDRALQDRQVVMAPVVLTELLSDPKLSAEVSQTLSELPLIEDSPGYCQRAGELRAKVLAKRRRARLGDALLAQSCIDSGIALLTRDRDFRAFAGAAGLDLPIGSRGRAASHAAPGAIQSYSDLQRAFSRKS
jgi:predicted nucleic acid-binding protein